MTSYNKVNGPHRQQLRSVHNRCKKEWGLCRHHHDRLVRNRETPTEAPLPQNASLPKRLVMPGTDTDRREILDALSAKMTSISRKKT